MGRKRKETSLVPNHKRPLVSCRICKAPATGFHYGIDACGACKGFFYRSINQNIHYRCEKDNNCAIDFHSIKFCQKCRYVKCLESGMSKTASKIGRYPSFKKTQELLERLGRTRDTKTDLDTSLPPVMDSDQAPEKQHSSGSENLVYTVPDSTAFRFFPTPPRHSDSQSPVWELLPLTDHSSPSLSPTSSSFYNSALTYGKNELPLPTLSSSSELSASNSWTSLDIAASDAPPLHFKSVTPPMAPTLRQNNDLTTSSDFKADCSSFLSFNHNNSNNNNDIFINNNNNNNNNNSSNNSNSYCNNNNASTNILLHSPSLAQIHDNLSRNTVSSGFIGGDASFTHELLSMNPAQQQCSHDAWSTSGSDLSSDELLDHSEAVDHSADSKINQELPDLNALSLVDESTAEVIENLPQLFADSDSIIQIFLETERKTLRLIHRDLTPQELLDAQIKHKEVCTFRTKMFGRKKFLKESEYEDFLNKTGMDIDDRQKYVSTKLNHLEAIIVGVATFAKTIPGFKYIPLEQKARLIKFARWDVCVISAFPVTNSDLMVSMSRHKGWICPLDFDEDVASTLFEPALTVMGKLHKLNLTDEEVVVLMAIAIVSPDRSEPTNSLLVSSIHSQLIELLVERLHRNHDQPMKMFATIISALTELRTLESHSSKMFLRGLNKVVQAELRERPLAKEMLPAFS